MIRFILFLFCFQQIFGAHSIKEEEVASYLLPIDHPIKKSLDELFSAGRWNFSESSMKKGGFEFSAPRKFTHLVIAKHPLVPGYIFKIYLDIQRYYGGEREFHWWIMRARGADLIRELIAKKGWDEHFKVPKKWIYKIPFDYERSKDYLPKNYILVEEDMDLHPHKENKAVWKSSYVTKSLLDKVYFILSELGLSDCAKIDNIPFSVDGKIAFIDTQSFHEPEVHYDSLNEYLNGENKTYWKLLYK